jgi:hypothetical protein
MEQKIKHLEFINSTVNRMANNSFLIKAWSVTLVSAAFALSTKDSNVKYLLFAFVPTFFFWCLDAYFLWQERLFRDHYNHVRIQEVSKIDFSMRPEKISKSSTFFRSFFSKTLLLYYLGIFVTLLIVIHFI